MLLDIRYAEGYGWHCGRLLLWFALLLVGVPLGFVGVLLQEIVSSAIHLSLPIALCIPLVFGLILYRRLKRKFQGQPFAVGLPAFFEDDMTTWLISRGHRHFRALVLVEIFIWGSVTAAQLGIIWVFHEQRVAAHQRSHAGIHLVCTETPSHSAAACKHSAT